MGEVLDSGGWINSKRSKRGRDMKCTSIFDTHPTRGTAGGTGRGAKACKRQFLFSWVCADCTGACVTMAQGRVLPLLTWLKVRFSLWTLKRSRRISGETNSGKKPIWWAYAFSCSRYKSPAIFTAQETKSFQGHWLTFSKWRFFSPPRIWSHKHIVGF